MLNGRYYPLAVVDQKGALMERCSFCHGVLDPATRRCQQCGRVQLANPPGAPLASASVPGTLTRRCPACGELLPASARFCGRCARSLELMPEAEPVVASDERSRVSPAIIGDLVGLSGVFIESAGSQTVLPQAPAAPQSAQPAVSAASGGPQTGAPGVPGAPAGPQAGVPTVPSASAAPQGAAPTVPTASAGAQTSLLGTTLAKVVLVLVVAVTVVGGAAGAILIITHARASQTESSGPTITVQSAYHEGSIPAGSTMTMLRVRGQSFSGSAAITFLLDGQPAPGARTVQSDASGAFQADLTITTDWKLGAHRLAARDATDKTAQQSVEVMIVPQGEANTPAPNGSPPDDASFVLATMDPSYLPSDHLMITGRADPAGGMPCFARDNGQPQMFSDNAGDDAQETWTCSGSYKGGKLTFTETLVNAQFTGQGYTCTGANTPLIDMQLKGEFTNATTISGTYYYSYATLMLHCTGVGGPGRGGGPPTGLWTAMITTVS